MNYVSGSMGLQPSERPPVPFLLGICCVGAALGLVSGIFAAALFHRVVTRRMTFLHMVLGGLWTLVPTFLPGWDHTIPFGAFLGGLILPALHVILFARRPAKHGMAQT